MSKREHIKRGVFHEVWMHAVEQNHYVLPPTYPEWIDGEWHDVTDALMALYHYVLAYAPQEEE